MENLEKVVKNPKRRNPKRIHCSTRKPRATQTLHLPVDCHYQICKMQMHRNEGGKRKKRLSCEFLFQERYRQSGESQGPTRSQQEGGSWSRQFAVHLFLHHAELCGNVSSRSFILFVSQFEIQIFVSFSGLRASNFVKIRHY